MLILLKHPRFKEQSRQIHTTRKTQMDFPSLVITVGVTIIANYALYWIIRSAVSAGIKDSRDNAAKERAEFKALQAKADRARRPSSKSRDSFQPPSKNNQVLNS